MVHGCAFISQQHTQLKCWLRRYYARLRPFVFFTLWLGALLFSPLSQAKVPVVLILSDSTPSYRAAVTGFASRYQGQFTTFLAKDIQGRVSLTDAPKAVFITIGARALHDITSFVGPDDLVISALAPKQSVLAIIHSGNPAVRISTAQMCRLYIDQPLERQMHLARLLLPNAKSVGVALSQQTLRLLPDIRKAADAEQLETQHTLVLNNENPVQRLRDTLATTDVFLTLPDQTIFTRTTAKWILYMSLRQRIPLIGFSKKYVDAGALAAVYTTPRQAGQEAADLLATNRCAGTETYPRYFSVSTNPAAARALRIDLPSEQQLHKALGGSDV